jgi:hypothetical protein
MQCLEHLGLAYVSAVVAMTKTQREKQPCIDTAFLIRQSLPL